jgi:hypothetical protein
MILSNLFFYPGIFFRCQDHVEAKWGLELWHPKSRTLSGCHQITRFGLPATRLLATGGYLATALIDYHLQVAAVLSRT